MMNKEEYLDVLKDYLLKSYSEEETLEILRDYEEYFINGKLDKKREEEIILELGSPKKIVEQLIVEDNSKVKKESFLEKIKNKVDKLFEKNISKRNSSILNYFEVYKKNLKTYMFILSFGLFFLSFISLFILYAVKMSMFFGVLSVATFFNAIYVYENKISTISLIINLFFVAIFTIFLLATRRDLSSFELGVAFSIIIMIVNSILFSFRIRGGILLIFLSFPLCIVFLFLILFLIALVLLTIGGVISAVVLTPYTIFSLNFLKMTPLYIVFPLLLAIGLFILMSIIIYYYSKALYKAILYSVNFLKIKFLYSKLYTKKFKKEEKTNERQIF